MATKEQIVQRIGDYIREKGHGPYGWYVGITDDPVRRLGEHKAKTRWIKKRADSHKVARVAEKALLRRVDCIGGRWR